MSKEAMKLALEALEVATTPFARDRQEVLRAQAVLREALAEPQEKYQYGTPLLDAMTGKANEALDKKAKPDFWEGYVPEPVKPAQQEPVAKKTRIGFVTSLGWDSLPAGTEFYTSPPAQRKPLTDEEISDLWCKVSNTDFVTADTHVFARAIEAAHGIKGDA